MTLEVLIILTYRLLRDEVWMEMKQKKDRRMHKKTG